MPHFNTPVLSFIYTTQHNTQTVMSAYSSYTYTWAKEVTALIKQDACVPLNGILHG